MFDFYLQVVKEKLCFFQEFSLSCHLSLASIGCTEIGQISQPIGVTVHSHCVEKAQFFLNTLNIVRFKYRKRFCNWHAPRVGSLLFDKVCCDLLWLVKFVFSLLRVDKHLLFFYLGLKLLLKNASLFSLHYRLPSWIWELCMGCGGGKLSFPNNNILN